MEEVGGGIQSILNRRKEIQEEYIIAGERVVRGVCEAKIEGDKEDFS